MMNLYLSKNLSDVWSQNSFYSSNIILTASLVTYYGYKLTKYIGCPPPAFFTRFMDNVKSEEKVSNKRYMISQ